MIQGRREQRVYQHKVVPMVKVKVFHKTMIVFPIYKHFKNKVCQFVARIQANLFC